MRATSIPRTRIWDIINGQQVSAEDAIIAISHRENRQSELFNASYEVLLQMLMRYFMHAKETEDELRTLSSTAVDLMFRVIKPLGQLLTTLPVGPNFPGKTVGATFEIYRTGYMLPHHQASWIVLHERLLELAAYCSKLSAQQPAP